MANAYLGARDGKCLLRCVWWQMEHACIGEVVANGGWNMYWTWFNIRLAVPVYNCSCKSGLIRSSSLNPLMQETCVPKLQVHTYMHTCIHTHTHIHTHTYTHTHKHTHTHTKLAGSPQLSYKTSRLLKFSEVHQPSTIYMKGGACYLSWRGYGGREHKLSTHWLNTMNITSTVLFLYRVGAAFYRWKKSLNTIKPAWDLLVYKPQHLWWWN